MRYCNRTEVAYVQDNNVNWIVAYINTFFRKTGVHSMYELLTSTVAIETLNPYLY